ncbi:choice-of-anchor B family protein [uncultured Planktosalinus sp.]|uniref:choice-of-anchor B family protein n=1 Tax=uncultured Planktosalinus sp. TaxID=1810935 RepID=UPI0030DC9D30
MKIKLLPLCLLFSGFLFAQTPCENGFAGSYPCDGYDLQSEIDLGILSAGAGNDSWGWTDPDTNKEYAIMCVSNGTAFIDISDPVNPIYLGKLPTQTDPSTWRDAKVYNNHAFIVSEASGHGMQIFDLTRLRNVNNPPETFTNDAHYDGFGRAHNIVINEENGYAYAVGTSSFSGGPHIVNIQNPTNPVFESGYSASDYTHDAQVVFYEGPDPDHAGKELFIGSNENEVVILDVTDKNNIQMISNVTFTSTSYSHQGWLTEDHRFFLMGDELDEIDFGFNTRTVIFDFTDLDSPFQTFDYTGPTTAIDHNGYVRGDTYYLANYHAGLRAIDISEIDNQVMTEVGYFDSRPSDNSTGFGGAWSVYPYFASGNIVISDVDRGFLLVKDPNFLSTESQSKQAFSVTPNPAQDFITIKSQETPISEIRILNTLGQEVILIENNNTMGRTLDISSLNIGMYFVVLNGNTTKKIIKK